jgi:hypothetical protein
VLLLALPLCLRLIGSVVHLLRNSLTSQCLPWLDQSSAACSKCRKEYGAKRAFKNGQSTVIHDTVMEIVNDHAGATQ